MIRKHSRKVADVLASFDIVALFTNLPTQLVIEVAEKRLGPDPSLEEQIPLRVAEVVKLLRFCLNQTHFMFN